MFSHIPILVITLCVVHITAMLVFFLWRARHDSTNCPLSPFLSHDPPKRRLISSHTHEELLQLHERHQRILDEAQKKKVSHEEDIIPEEERERYLSESSEIINTPEVIRPYELIETRVTPKISRTTDDSGYCSRYQLYQLHDMKENIGAYIDENNTENINWDDPFLSEIVEGTPTATPVDNNDLGNWNIRFQKIIEGLASFNTNTTLEERLNVTLDLIHLSQDFIYCSSTYGKIIISEVYLPPEQKTIKPQSLGFAGGEKYFIHNIMFKFSFDFKGLYGSDYASAKVAGHDLKGLISYLNCWVKGMSLPLMALVDYRGFRLTAMSILPIGKDTLIYGSNDNGTTIHADDPVLNSKMRKIAKQLNIKPHFSGLSREKSCLIYSASDIEGHKARDGKYYLLDFSRTWPPETPKSGVKSAHLYRLLRPEFVKTNDLPLCSDAFSGFIAAQPKMMEHNLEIKQATTRLINEVIPAFAITLVQDVVQESKKGRLEKFRLVELVHREGINIRYLGHIRSLVAHEHVKTLLFINMAARVIKNCLRLRLREKIRELKVPLQEPYVRVVVDYLNLVFGESSASDRYWNTELKIGIQKKFEEALSQKETEPGFALKCVLDLLSDERVDGKLMLFKSLRKMTGLQFSTRLLKDFEENRNAWLSRGDQPFDDTDLKEIGLRVKHMNIIAHAEGVFFKMKGNCNWDRDPVVSKRNFHKATKKFMEALDTDPNNCDTLCNMAEVRQRLIEGESRGLSHMKFAEDDPNVQDTKNLYKRAITSNPMDATALFHYAQFLDKCNKPEAAQKYYLRSLEADPNNLDCLHEYGNFLAEYGEPDEAEKFYLRAMTHPQDQSMAVKVEQPSNPLKRSGSSPVMPKTLSLSGSGLRYRSSPRIHS